MERQSGERGRGSNERQHGSDEPRRRVYRSLEMSDEEHAARLIRHARYAARFPVPEEQDKEEQDKTLTGQTTSPTDGDEPETSGLIQSVEDTGPERKPWETLVIGDLGENLSHIERKDREIERHRFIVRYHEEHSPRLVEHNKRILNRLIQERSEMEDNEENNMPEDQRERPERIAQRLELLRWALDSSVCDDEKINIRTAIHGYESGQIPYSLNFTLLYAGHIVDTCGSYHEFCANRSERLDGYFAKHGPGWLWHEPPLAGSGADGLAMKGICLDRKHYDRYSIGIYEANLEFTIQPEKVSRVASTTRHPRNRNRKRKRTEKSGNTGASCQLQTLLDSGATFPVILDTDLVQLDVNLARYPAQGMMQLHVVGGSVRLRFYEMYVSVCSSEGKSMVDEGTTAVWPDQPRSLGGFCPVLAQKDTSNGKGSMYAKRLSGMIPFDACYISSAPTMARLWLGEDRRDVLGTSRLPAHLRFDTDNSFHLKYADEFEELRREAHTPDRVVFVHNSEKRPDTILTDVDTQGAPGKSELAIGQYQPPGTRSRVVPKRVIRVEPRKGGYTTVPKKDVRPWQKEFNK